MDDDFLILISLIVVLIVVDIMVTCDMIGANKGTALGVPPLRTVNGALYAQHNGAYYKVDLTTAYQIEEAAIATAASAEKETE